MKKVAQMKLYTKHLTLIEILRVCFLSCISSFIKQILYPETEWVNGRFKVASPEMTWVDRVQTRSFLKFLEPKLLVERPEDWYRISRKQARVVGSNLTLASSYALGEAAY